MKPTPTGLLRFAPAAAIALVFALAACVFDGGDSGSAADGGSIVARPSASPDQQLASEVGAAFAADGAEVDRQPAGSDLAALTGSAGRLLRTAAPRIRALSPAGDPAQLLERTASSTTPTSRATASPAARFR